MAVPGIATKVASALTKAPDKLGSGDPTKGMADAEKLEHLVNRPDSAVGQAAGAQAGVGPAASAQSTSTSVHALSALHPAASGQAGASPGDRILKGIDNTRHEFGDLTADMSKVNSTQKGGLTNISDIMKTQRSMIGFEVDVQAGGKAVQESNSGIQTLLKGQ